MKTAEIDWQLFWQAASQQTNEGKNSWLRRWAFADDSVRLSMRRLVRDQWLDRRISAFIDGARHYDLERFGELRQQVLVREAL